MTLLWTLSFPFIYWLTLKCIGKKDDTVGKEGMGDSKQVTLL